MAVKVGLRDRNENRFTMKCRVVSTKYGEIVAEGQGVIVTFV